MRWRNPLVDHTFGWIRSVEWRRLTEGRREGWKTRDSSVWGWLLTIFTHGFSILSVVWNPSFCSLLKPCKRKKTRWRDPLVSLRMTSHRWTKRTHGTGNARMAWWYRFLGLLLWTGIQNCDVSKDRLLLDLYFPWSLLKSGWLPEVSMGTYLWRTSLVFSCRVKYSQISMVSRWLGNARKMVEYTHYFGTSTNFSRYLEGYMSNVIIHVNGQYLCIIVHSHCIFSPTEWFESNQQTKVSQTWLKIERMISWNINSVISYLRSFA